MSPSNRRHRDRAPHREHAVAIIGRRRATLDSLVDEEPNVAAVRRRIEFDCSSGRPITGTWTGFRILPLLERVGVPGGTTHLSVESTQGHAACVAIGGVMEGLLAFERDGAALDGLRFVAPDIVGPRAVKHVRRVEVVELAPGTDRSTLETI